MLVDGNEIDPDTSMFGGIPKEVRDGTFQLLKRAFPRMRGEVVRCFYVFRVDEFGAVGKSAISSIGLDPTKNFTGS